MKSIIIFLFFTFISLQLYTHSGRTDSKGGHYDRINGGYHYHDGSSYSGYKYGSNSSKVIKKDEGISIVWKVIGVILLFRLCIFIFNQILLKIKRRNQ